MQIGIINEEAAKRAAEAGFKVIMDKCMMIEHGRLSTDGDLQLKRIRAKKMKELLEKAARKTASPREIPSSPLIVSDADFDQIVQKYPLIVVDFWAPWCGPCRMMAPIIDELAEDYAGKVIFGKLNVDENPQTATRFGIMGIPTFLIIKNGKEVERLVGAVPKQSLEAKLRKYVAT
jgi:thioredoxin 1